MSFFSPSPETYKHHRTHVLTPCWIQIIHPTPYSIVDSSQPHSSHSRSTPRSLIQNRTLSLNATNEPPRPTITNTKHPATCHYTLIPTLCPKCKSIAASITERDGPGPYFEELMFPINTPASCPAGVLTPNQPHWHISELMEIQCDRCTAVHGFECEQEIGAQLLSPLLYLPHDPEPPVASSPACSRGSVSSPPGVDTFPNLNNPPGNNSNNSNNNPFGSMSVPPQPQPPTSHNDSILSPQAATTGNQLKSESRGSTALNPHSPTSAPRANPNESTSAPSRNPSVSVPVFLPSSIETTLTPEAAIMPNSYIYHPNVTWHEKRRG